MAEVFVPRFVARLVVGRSEFFRSRFESRSIVARRSDRYRVLARGYRDQVLCAFERDHRRLMRRGWFPLGSLRRWLDRLHARDAYPVKEE